MRIEKLTENMIRFAESKLDSTEYAGWCLAFIEDAFEISNHIEIYGGDSAKESCEMYKDALRLGVPERGAFVFSMIAYVLARMALSTGDIAVSVSGTEK